MSPHFATRCVSRLLGLAKVSWSTACVGVIRLFPFFLPCLCSFRSSPAVGLHSCFFFKTDVHLYMYLLPFELPLHLLMASSRLGTASGTRCCVLRGGAWGAHEAEISFQISALAGVC